ncbi:hypothetical protein K6W36_08935 [Acetobacter senegalensis]|nr:hypothetical protein [Acetobacter senegalensis]MCG4260709.1 hypothetical protein [Acetobacter senegalensis]
MAFISDKAFEADPIIEKFGEGGRTPVIHHRKTDAIHKDPLLSINPET